MPRQNSQIDRKQKPLFFNLVCTVSFVWYVIKYTVLWCRRYYYFALVVKREILSPFPTFALACGRFDFEWVPIFLMVDDKVLS